MPFSAHGQGKFKSGVVLLKLMMYYGDPYVNPARPAREVNFFSLTGIHSVQRSIFDANRPLGTQGNIGFFTSVLSFLFTPMVNSIPALDRISIIFLFSNIFEF
jgi:hypothetical protein